MAKQKQKYYAVHNGREGTQIYRTWEEVRLPQLLQAVATLLTWTYVAPDEGECKHVKMRVYQRVEVLTEFTITR
ncbi:hypothetical protein OH76DRAFT_607403 [Lentinus brumalis]|uniref:Ribonuclease H1 N-terminal domain-containing protein n=1 Tax=Lentinus brumalis TaxID=2498619 RepID=A0A371DUN4_9APHY|nr:hypothetical protein OH76DRAFT_607403 [Polyporus brumalis]